MVKNSEELCFVFDFCHRAPIDEGTEKTIVIRNEIAVCDGLAVDWIYNHIYWTDTGKNTIELANYEGGMRKTLIKSSLDEPRAIALNPLDGYGVNILYFDFFNCSNVHFISPYFYLIF